MTSNWSYHNPTRVLFGDESLSTLGDVADDLAGDAPVALFTGRSAAARHGYRQEVRGLLGSSRTAVFGAVEPEPSQATVDAGRRFVEQHGARLVIGLGGGSVLDVAKAVGVTAYTDLSIERVMDRQVSVKARTLPVIALPTTAGSGSEVTPFAVLTHPTRQDKQSLPSPHLYPDVAVIAPKFLCTVPQQVIGDSGMDALAHALEALWSTRANSVSDAMAFRAVDLVRSNLLAYYRNSYDTVAATAMAVAATLAGMAFSNTFTAACHALSYPIGKRFGLSHGASCAMTLDLVADLNREVAADKFASLSCYLGLPAAQIPAMIRSIRTELKTIPTFQSVGATREDLAAIAAGAFRPLLANNPVPLSEGDIVQLLLPELEAGVVRTARRMTSA